MAESKHKVCTEPENFWKVSTNTHGGLRFKMADIEDGKLVDEDEAVRRYADQISNDRQQFGVGDAAEKEGKKDVMKLPGFQVRQIRDTTRCLKQVEPEEAGSSVSESVSDFSTELLTD